jgi:hypothetical protein
MKLYEIAEEYRRVLEAVKCGEIPEEAIADTVEMMSGEFGDKVDSVICVYKELLAEEAAIRVEAAALKARADVKAHAAERLLGYVQRQMEVLQLNKIETAKNEVTLKKKPPKVVIEDEAMLYSLRPDLFTVKEPEPSKTAIAALLKAGEEVAGCRLEQSFRMAVK